MSDYNILKDFDNEEVKEKLNSLKKDNNNLYQAVRQSIKESYFSGIREDVFEYIIEHASEFPSDFDSIYSISQFINNRKMDTTWYEFVNNKGKDITKDIPLVDFCYMITEAVDKDISFSEFYALYEKHIDNPLTIMEDIDNYNANNDSLISDEAISGESDDDNSISEDTELSYNADDNKQLSEHVDNNVEIPSYNREPEFASLFGDILTIMSDKDDDERFNLQEKIQSNVSELSVMLSSIFRLWDNDRHELKQMKSYYNLQQRVLYSQQQKINQMRYDIELLQSRLNEAGKNEAKREEMKKKINEMQELMFSEIDKSSRIEAGGL